MTPDDLRSETPEGVRKEAAAKPALVNIVRMSIVEAAAEHGTHPLRTSFARATRTILVFAHALGAEPM